MEKNSVIYKGRPKIIIAMLLLVGFLLFACGVVIHVIWNNTRETHIPVEAVITNISTQNKFDDEVTHIVYIEYEYQGKTYSNTAGYYLSSMREGDYITVYIDPENPSKLGLSAGSWLFKLFYGMGIAFISGGIYSSVSSKKKQWIAVKHYIGHGTQTEYFSYPLDFDIDKEIRKLAERNGYDIREDN